MQVSTSVSAGTRSQGDTKRAVFPVGHMVLFSLVTVLFFLWGMSNNLTDILVQQFKKSFELSTFSAQLVSTANFTGYFCMAIPAALVMRGVGSGDSGEPVHGAVWAGGDLGAAAEFCPIVQSAGDDPWSDYRRSVHL